MSDHHFRVAAAQMRNAALGQGRADVFAVHACHQPERQSCQSPLPLVWLNSTSRSLLSQWAGEHGLQFVLLHPRSPNVQKSNLAWSQSGKGPPIEIAFKGSCKQKDGGWVIGHFVNQKGSYSFKCMECRTYEGGARCAHFSVLQIAVRAGPACCGIDPKYHSLLSLALQLCGGESGPGMATKSKQLTQEAPAKPAKLESADSLLRQRSRMIRPMCLRFLAFPVACDSGTDTCPTRGPFQHLTLWEAGEHMDTEEKRRGRRAVTDGCVHEHILPPSTYASVRSSVHARGMRVTDRASTTTVHHASGTLRHKQERHPSTQWVTSLDGQFQPFIAPWIEPHGDQPLLFAASQQLARSSRTAYGRGFSDAFEAFYTRARWHADRTESVCIDASFLSSAHLLQMRAQPGESILGVPSWSTLAESLVGSETMPLGWYHGFDMPPSPTDDEAQHVLPALCVARAAAAVWLKQALVPLSSHAARAMRDVHSEVTGDTETEAAADPPLTWSAAACAIADPDDSQPPQETYSVAVSWDRGEVPLAVVSRRAVEAAASADSSEMIERDEHRIAAVIYSKITATWPPAFDRFNGLPLVPMGGELVLQGQALSFHPFDEHLPPIGFELPGIITSLTLHVRLRLPHLTPPHFSAHPHPACRCGYHTGRLSTYYHLRPRIRLSRIGRPGAA